MSSYGHDHTFFSGSSSVGGGIRRRPKGRTAPGKVEKFFIALVDRLQSSVYAVLRAAVQRFLAFYTDMKSIDCRHDAATMPALLTRKDSGVGEREESVVQRAGLVEIFKVRLPEPSEIAVYKQWQLAPIRLAKRAVVKRNFSTLQSKWRTPAKSSKEARRGHEEASRSRHQCQPSSSTPYPNDNGPCGRLDGVPLYNAFSSSFVQGVPNSLLPRSACVGGEGNECAGPREQTGASFDLDDSDLEEGDTEDDELDSILSSTIAPSTTATSSNMEMEKRLAELEAKLAVLMGSQQPIVTPPEVTSGVKLGECNGKKEEKKVPIVPTAPPPPPPGLLPKSKGAMLPPPPPPLPPTTISDTQTRAAPAQQASINQAETAKLERPQLPSTSINGSSKPKTMAMTDVLRDLSSAMNRLRKVERSPGGTPMTASKSAKSRQSIGGRANQPMPKPRLFQRKLFGTNSTAPSLLAEEHKEGKENAAEMESVAEEVEKLSPYDFMCQALARKFENTHLNEDEEEEEEDDEARENEGVSRRVSHLRDSSWADDSWRDSIGATPKK